VYQGYSVPPLHLIAVIAVLVSMMVGTEKSVDGDFPSSLPSTKRTEGRRHEMKVLLLMQLAWVKSALADSLFLWHWWKWNDDLPPSWMADEGRTQLGKVPLSKICPIKRAQFICDNSKSGRERVWGIGSSYCKSRSMRKHSKKRRIKVRGKTDIQR